MAPDSTSDDFYRIAPTFRDFRLVADEFSFSPLPEDWLIGVADVEQSTKAIQDKRYKAVNMAGAAVIAAVANALGGRDFPFVFGGDGASFAVSPANAGIARQALAETATWVREDLADHAPFKPREIALLLPFRALSQGQSALEYTQIGQGLLPEPRRLAD